MEKEYYYRIRDVSYASIDEYGDIIPGGGRLELRCEKIPVVRKTPKGAWIGFDISQPHFVLTSAKKRFACPTIEEAKESFRARKKREASIHQARVNRAKAALALLDSCVDQKFVV